MIAFIQHHQTLYWTGICILAMVCCTGWYSFGATRPGKIELANTGKHSPALLITWRFKPFAHSLTFHLWNVAIVARLESSATRVAAALEIQMGSTC
jgi:hypothetical protein